MDIQAIIITLVIAVFIGMGWEIEHQSNVIDDLHVAIGKYEANMKVLGDTIKIKDADIDAANASIIAIKQASEDRAKQAQLEVDKAKKDSQKNEDKAKALLARQPTDLSPLGLCKEADALFNDYLSGISQNVNPSLSIIK